MHKQQKPLVLHIGLGKTGTTVLQRFLAQNREVLLERGIEYPQEGLVDHAHHLFSPHVPHYMQQRWTFVPVSDWAGPVSAKEASSILLSSELMSSASADEIAPYCNELRAHFDVRVVIYLRRQDHMLASTYNQQVKSGRQKRPLGATWLKRLPAYDYLEKLRRWESAVGRDALVVRPFEREQLEGGDIRTDFLHHVYGMEVDEAFVLSEDDPNPALASDVLEFKRQLNWVVTDRRFHRRCNRLLQSFVDSTRRPGQSVDAATELMTPNERVALLGALSATNAEVARRYGIDREGRLFREPLPQRTRDHAAPVSKSVTGQEILRFFNEHDEEVVQQIAQLVEAQGEPLGAYHSAALAYLREALSQDR